MKKIEFIYRGTPYELAQFALDFGMREMEDNPVMWQNSFKGNPYATYPRQIHLDSNPIGIVLIIDNPNPLFEGRLNAQLYRTSDEKIRTMVTGRIETDGDEIDRQIAARYQKLYDELNRLGLVELQPSPIVTLHANPSQDTPAPNITNNYISIESGAQIGQIAVGSNITQTNSKQVTDLD